jgi:DNA polymerase III delta prime subunit
MTQEEIFQIEMNIKAQLKLNKNKVNVKPISIAGQPGIAKTTTVKNLAEKLGMSINSISMPAQTVELFGGLPTFKDSPTMSQYNIIDKEIKVQSTEWTVPEILENTNRLAEKSENGCILLLDDLHKTPPYLMPFMYTLLGEYRLRNFRFHPKVVFIATMNASDESGFRQLDSGIKDRLSIMFVEFDQQAWFENIGPDLNPLVVSLLKANLEIIQEKETAELEPTATSRTWTQISNELNMYPKSKQVEMLSLIAKRNISKDALTKVNLFLTTFKKVDLIKLITEKKVHKIADDLDSVEKALYGQITNYLETPEDLVFLLKFLEENDDILDINFELFMTGFLYNKYVQNKLTIAQDILIQMILETFDPKNYNLTKTVASKLTKLKLNPDKAINLVITFNKATEKDNKKEG